MVFEEIISLSRRSPGGRSRKGIAVEETSRSAEVHSKVAGGLPALRSGHADLRFSPPEIGVMRGMHLPNEGPNRMGVS